MPRHNVVSLSAGLQESRESYSPPFSPESRSSQGNAGNMESFSRLTIPSAHSSTAVSPSSYRRRSVAYQPIEEEQYQKLASHIWGGQISHDSYMKLLDRVRLQFRKPQMHGHDPLTFPPVIPSASRPQEPEIPRFSRGIRLLRHGLHNFNSAAAAKRVSETSSESVLVDGSVTSEGQPSSKSETGTLPPLEATTASFAIFELESADEKQERLNQLETLERRRVEATEKWDRNVVNEMMVVHYVTYVLKPEMEEIQAKERFVRGMIRYDEEKAFYYLFNESPIAQVIHTEARALMDKQEKLARLSQLETDYLEKKPPLSSRMNVNAMRQFGAFGAFRSKEIKDVNVVETSKLPDQVQDARAILQRYVREKYKGLVPSAEAAVPLNGVALNRESTPFTPNTVRRVSSIAVPPITSAPRRNTLGVADYITLLEEDDQYRGLIEVAERAERRDIVRLKRDDYRAVMDWQRKHMHLQRLVYWRSQHEENLLKELDQMSKTVGARWSAEAIQSFQAHVAEEEVARQEIEQEAAAELEGIQQRTKFEVDCFQQRQLMKKAVEARKWVEAQYFKEMRIIVAEEEASARAEQLRCREVFLKSAMQPKSEVLRMLYKISIRPRAFRAVLRIQRTYFRYKQGMMGYKRTHRRIAEEIKAKRTQAEVSRGLDVFKGYRAQLQREMDEIDHAALQQFIKKSKRLLQEESQERLILDSKEAMTFSNLKRRFVRELREDILGGKLSALLRRELEERTEREVTEQLRYSGILTFCRSLAHVILSKENTELQENLQRNALVNEEDGAKQELWSDEYDRREEIRIEAAEEAERLRVERANYAVQLEAEREACADSLLQEHFLFINKQQQRGVTKHAFEDVFYNQAFAMATADVIQAWTTWAVECHAVLGWVDCLDHQTQIHLREVELHEENEKLTRRAMSRKEDDVFYEIQKSYQKMREDTQEKLDDEQRAVRRLIQTWRKYRRGDLGRSGTRKFLHEAFRPKREKLEIAKRNAENLKHIHAVRDELVVAEQNHVKDTIDCIEMKLQVLENKTEPRARWDITDKEDMIWTIMRNNFYSTGIRAFDPRNKMALLWQEESYERVMIKREWRRVFDTVFGPKKATFREDVSIRPIQRAWRRYVVRRERKKVHTAEQDVLAQAELSDRFYIMEREAVLYRDLSHQLMEEEWEASWLYGISPGSVEDTQAVALESLVKQEWNERADLLWEMRYDLCDGYLSTLESRARKLLVVAEFLPGKQQAEFYGEESLTRALLEQERGFFLLRMLCKQERAHRQAMEAEAAMGTEEQWMRINEELARNGVVEAYCQFWRESIYEPLAKGMEQELEKQERAARGLTDFFAIENMGRCSIIDDEVIARQRQVILMEYKMRGLIHTNEQFQRQGSVTLFWTEEKERLEIMMTWAQGMHYGPSNYAPHLVYDRMPVYVRCVEDAEVLVREYLESSERSAAELLFTYISYLREEYELRGELKVEEKIVREQRTVLLEEQQCRSEIIADWARGVRYVPSSFAPEIVNQRINVFLGAVEQTECISRDYIQLAEDIAFRSMKREKMYLDYEEQERLALERLEHEELRADIIAVREEKERKEIEELFQSGLFYAPSSFAPTMVNQEIPLYVRCITDSEELVRRHMEHQEFNMRAFYRRDMYEKEAYARESDAAERQLREQREALCREERVGRKAVWRDTFEFVRREGDFEEDADDEDAKNTVRDEGELELPEPLPPVIIQNQRYVTYVEGTVALEGLSRQHLWSKYVHHLRKICRTFFPEKPEPEFEDAPLEEDFLDSSDEEEEDSDEDSQGGRRTLMLVRDDARPDYHFKRMDNIP